MDIVSFDKTIDNPIIGRTSKGDQIKWFHKGSWYKVDNFGYEGLAETVVSGLLHYSNIEDVLDYKPVIIKYNGKKQAGCVSKNFLQPNEELITLERLHTAYKGEGLSNAIEALATTSERIKYTTDFVTDITGIERFADWLTLILETDAFFLNEDRHTANIALIRNTKDGEWKLCPVFDNGLSLLSDVKDYPFNIPDYINRRNVKAKPFASDFSKQIKAANDLYGTKLKFSFDKNDIERELSGLTDYYDAEKISRVRNILYMQMEKYPGLFKSDFTCYEPETDL